MYQELRALNDYLGLGYEMFFWRTASGAEVDFVLYGERGIIACEVKRSRRLSKADLAGLTLFRSDYPSARCILLFGGDRREFRHGIELIPFEKGFRGLRDIL